MRKQKSPCTLSSYNSISEWVVSSPSSCNYASESHSNYLWPQFLTMDPSQVPEYQDFPPIDLSGAGDMPPQNFYPQDPDYPETIIAESYATYDDSWNPTQDYFVPGETFNDSYAFPAEGEAQYLAEEPFQQRVLEYGVPTITDYGAVALLLRHLIRVDLTADGSVFVYNYPAASIATLDKTGKKCYVKHPNASVFQEGPVTHMMVGNGRFVKISRKRVTFSSAFASLAYAVDEAGTKTTTTGKFTDLSEDLMMNVFYDGNRRNIEELAEGNYKLVSEAMYQKYSEGGELWVLGNIRIVQDRWGQVTVTHVWSNTTIKTSPTIRMMAVESPSVSISIDCYSKNYLTVRKGACVVTSGYCGLIVQNRTQKAGLDRRGRLVLF